MIKYQLIKYQLMNRNGPFRDPERDTSVNTEAVCITSVHIWKRFHGNIVDGVSIFYESTWLLL